MARGRLRIPKGASGEVDGAEEPPEPTGPPTPEGVRPNGGEPSVPAGGDTAERIRIAAESAAEQAEHRAMDEILALEEDLERAKDEAAEARAEAERQARNEVAKHVEIQTRTSAASSKRYGPRSTSGFARPPTLPARRPRPRPRLAASWRSAPFSSSTETRKQVEDRIRAEIEETTRVEIERLRGEAEERTRVEVEATRRAAEQRFKAEIRLREQELESEREDKTRIIDESDACLHEIEQRALAGAERVAAAEAELAQEAERLRKEAEARVAEETERAHRNATNAADAQVREREERLIAATAEADRAKAEAERIGGEDLEPPGWVLDEAPVPAASETGEWDIGASVPEADPEPPASPGEGRPRGPTTCRRSSSASSARSGCR